MSLENIDKELEEIIEKRIASLPKKLLFVGTGITSSHLGDERNIREFLIANALVENLRNKGHNIAFFLFDDSYDPLNFRQLRVAVNKDEALIKKFEKYCGMPIRLIPDPYDCHQNYSAHYQNQILERLYHLGIYPTIIDSYNSYESGMYDKVKEIVFTRYKEINAYLKKEFPNYHMKKLFCPVCPKCLMMDGVDIKEINKDQVTVDCSPCGHTFTDSYKNIHGKFGWKLDVAVKWNIYHTDFEPFSKAYLDPDVGSYFIAKKLSEAFFGGYSPEIISYGQILMDKSLSYKVLSSLPKEAFFSFFLTNRKRDMELSERKFEQFARDFKIEDNLSFYDYIINLLQYDLYDRLQGKPSSRDKYVDYGIAFAANFLNKNVYPALPTEAMLSEVSDKVLQKICQLFLWVVHHKIDYPEKDLKVFSEDFLVYSKEHNLNRKVLFPVIRKVLSQEHALPMYKVFYYASLPYLSGCLLIMTKIRAKRRKEKNA